MNKKHQHLFFDFDDTLAMNQAACMALENEAAAHLGLPPVDPVLHRQTFGLIFNQAIAKRYPGADVEMFKAKAFEIHDRYIREDKIDIIAEDVYTTLDTLKAHYTFGVLTSREPVESGHLLDPRHRLTSYIPAHRFYHLGKTRYHKPDPRVFHVIAEDLDIDLTTIIYVGDSLGDAQAALGAGVTFIATLQSGLRDRRDFETLGVKYFVAQFSDLPDILHTLE